MIEVNEVQSISNRSKRKVVGIVLDQEEWEVLDRMRREQLRSMSNLVSLMLRASIGSR